MSPSPATSFRPLGTLAPVVDAGDEDQREVSSILSRSELADYTTWKRSFIFERKDHRYYDIVEDTMHPELEHSYFIARDGRGFAVAVQPLFCVDVDLLEGAAVGLKRLADRLRRYWPRFMRLRTLMVGCVAGEGHLSAQGAASTQLVEQLTNELPRAASRHNASLIVWKEFPAQYRDTLATLTQSGGYARVASLPMTSLNIDYRSFEEYMTSALSRATRKSLRRTFRKTEAAAKIELTIVEDATPFVFEIYPLYEQVYNRSNHHFEKLTPDFIAGLGRRMPDKTRFFLWRVDGKAVAFSICMVHGDTIWDEYLGLDYSVALHLHLYQYTFRDIVSWAMANGYKSYRSSGLNYDPKLHWRSRLEPLDLYVRHVHPGLNAALQLILPWLGPVRHVPTLKKFANYREL